MAKARKKFESLAPSLRRKLSQLPEDDAQRFVKEGEHWMKELLSDPHIRELLATSPEFVQGRQIAARLIAGTLNLLFRANCQALEPPPSAEYIAPIPLHPVLGADTSDSLDPFDVGLFLAILSNSKPDDLQWKLGLWFKWFRIVRRSRLGRPKGRRSESEQYLCFRTFERLLEMSHVWSIKQEFQRNYHRSWKSRLREDLRKDDKDKDWSWGPEEIDCIIESSSPRSLALNLTANQLGIQYDTVRRSVQRHSRS